MANVNVSSKPPHIGASRRYLEDVTAAEFCEEGGHWTARLFNRPQTAQDFLKTWRL